MDYDLELDRVVKMIRAQKAKRVCIQLPDGLKPKAKEIVDRLKMETGSQILTWAGSCFGACDLPLGLERVGVDMLIQFGHSEWKK